MNYLFTKFNANLRPEFNALQAAYRRMYPSAKVALAGPYGPMSEGGANIICALDEDGKLRGYAPVYAAIGPDMPHTFWTDVKIDPELASAEGLRHLLFEKVLNRVSEISQTLTEGERRLAFEYHASEQGSISFALAKGAVYAESALGLRRDLSRELQVMPAFTDTDIRFSEMDDEAEQRSYIDLYNEIMVKGRRQLIVPAAMSLVDWQTILKHLKHRTVILACHGEQIVGSILLFWNEEENLSTGRKVGTIDNVFVREDWRRRGIASRMISRGFEYFKENGLEIARLEVNSANPPALKLYESLGFVTSREIRMFVLALS